MARGRIINNKISLNRKFNVDLSSDTCRMFFMMTISHLDVDGRTYGDPQILKAQVIPWREDITNDQVKGYIEEWVNLGFVKWYEVDKVKYLWFPSFKENQPNLRAERETPSNIPEYQSEFEIEIDADDCRSNAGVTPELLPEKIKIKSKIKINTSKDKINKDSNSIELPLKDIVPSEFEENRKAFHNLLWALFTKISFDHFKTKEDRGREAPAIKRMIEDAMARAPTFDEQKVFLGNFLRTAKYVFSGEVKDMKFLKGSPFIPSVIMSKGIKPRIIETMKDQIKQQEISENYEVPW